jgi:O-antigen/teichoic acid export membrane protein
MVLTQIVGSALGPIALLLGRVVGQSAGIIGLARSAFNKNADDFKSTTGKDIKYGASNYRNFPFISTWTGLASSAGLNLPPLLIAGFLGVSSAGLFSLAHRVLSQPMAVIGKAVSDAFYQKAAQANREGNLGSSVESVYSVLVKLALPPAITIFVVIPDVFIFVFGAEWALAGELARWMTPWLFFQFVVSPCTGIYPIINRHDIALKFQLSLLASSILGSIVGGFYFNSLMSVVIIISILSSLVYLWRAITTFKVVGRPASNAFRHIVKSIPLSIFINIPLLFYYGFSKYSFLFLVLAVFVTVIFWLLFLVKPLWKSQE